MSKGNVQFQFNLLPKTSKEEIIEIKTRDESTTYGIILIFVGVFLFLLLNIIHIGFIKPRLSKLDSDIKKLTTTEDSFKSIVSTNGELVRKSQLLEVPLKLDIKINDFLSISDRVFNPFGRIVSYDRDAKTGDFLVTLNSTNIDNIVNLVADIKSSEEITSAQLLDLNLLRDRTFNVIIQFSLEAKNLNILNETGT